MVGQRAQILDGDRAMLTGEDIMCLSTIDWDFLWQGHQEIMSTFAAQGNRVLFVENTGVRTPTWRDLPRLRQRIRNWRRGVQGIRQERENLYVYSPILLPFPYSRLAQWINRRIFLRTIRRWMVLMQARQPIIWTFLPTGLALDVIRSVPHRLVVYYCIDNFEESSPEAKRKVGPSEQRVLREADLVFVTSEALADRCAPAHGTRPHWFPFGVALRDFPSAASTSTAVPADLAQLRRPLIGYVGGIHQWLDQALVRSVAQQLPEHSFALVGPIQTDVSALTGLPNVHLLGAKSHEALSEYIQAFDACLIPYRLTEYTRYVYPTKLNEYFALGKPVIATPIQEIVTFNTRYQDPVRIGESAEAFAAHIRAAVSENGDHADARRRIAQQNSWEARIEAMSRLIQEELDRRTHERQIHWRDVLRTVYQISARRMRHALVMLALGWVVLFHTPLLWWVAAPLRIQQPLRQADAIIVLGGGVGESGQAGQGYQERVEYAVELYRRGYAPRVMFSSGYIHIFQEAAVMKALAVSLSIPADRITLETASRNTYENLVHTTQWLRSQGAHQALLVSSPYHMRRAMLVARAVAPDLTMIPTPILHSDFYGDQRHVAWKHVRAVLHEYLAILVYWAYGYLTPGHAVASPPTLPIEVKDVHTGAVDVRHLR